MGNRLEIKITYRNQMNVPIHSLERQLIKMMHEMNYERKSTKFSFRTNITEMIFEGENK